MKLTHKEKVKLARKMRANNEIKGKVSIWLTKAWEQRKKARFIKELNKRREVKNEN
jgi:hypothetical protein